MSKENAVYHVNMIWVFCSKAIILTDSDRNNQGRGSTTCCLLCSDCWRGFTGNDLQLHLPIVSLKQTETWTDVLWLVVYDFFLEIIENLPALKIWIQWKGHIYTPRRPFEGLWHEMSHLYIMYLVHSMCIVCTTYTVCIKSVPSIVCIYSMCVA